MGSIDTVIVRLQKTHDEAQKNPTVIKVDNERYLTSGEIEMAKLIFKNSIKYSIVKIKCGGLFGVPDKTGNAMTPAGYIHLPTEDYKANRDFSLPIVKATVKHWFIHEMTHVWQYQHGFSPAVSGAAIGLCGGYGDRALAYNYDLSKEIKRFNEYNMEQQGDIVADYFDVIYPFQIPHDRIDLHQQHVKNFIKLKMVLKDFLVNPSDLSLVPNYFENIKTW